MRAGKPAQSDALKQRLSAMRKFVPWGSSTPFIPLHMRMHDAAEDDEEGAEEAAEEQQDDKAEPAEDIEPLELWRPGVTSNPGFCKSVQSFNQMPGMQ